ncbi:MAG TPA: EndoU domain-containing protein [Actinomycetota bacterium]|nr:EndoU domain-containing protein [Actinomycetota bacterium]
MLQLQRAAGNRATGTLLGSLRVQRQKFGSQEAAADWLEGQEEPGPKEHPQVYARRVLAGSVYGAPPGDFNANVRLVQAVLRARKDEGKKKPVIPPRQERATSDVMDHIMNGEIREGGAPKGFHSVNGDRPLVEKTPGTQGATDDLGCYHSGVRSIDGQIAKPKGSSFFPDTWDADRIKAAIDGANPSGRHFETREGIKLLFNDASFFPDKD